MCYRTLSVSEFNRRDATYLHSYCRSCNSANTRTYRGKSPEARLLHGVKARAKSHKIPFNLELSDLTVPSKCPVLGIPLIREYSGRVSGTPSVDRIDPSKGYVRGNVVVISWRANRLKSNATLQELEALASFYRRFAS